MAIELKPVSENNFKECPYCGEKILQKAKKCKYCGEMLDPVMREMENLKRRNDTIPIIVNNNNNNNNISQFRETAPVSTKSRLTYILLALLLGMIGIHNFYAGYNGRGTAQLLLTIFTGWLLLPLIPIMIWNIVEVCVVNRDGDHELME